MAIMRSSSSRSVSANAPPTPIPTLRQAMAIGRPRSATKVQKDSTPS
jgi:hypothetical protein